MPPITAFITGLTTGGLTCLAVQGGLLIGLLARRQGTDEQSRQFPRWQLLLLPVAAFLVAKLVSHTFLGAGLGWLGDKIQISTTVRLWLQVIAALFMLVAGIRLLAPGFMPWLTITPPASLRRLVRRSAKSQALIAPAVLGFLTIFIPCGTTQAMELAAVAAGNALQGASIMFAFVLGTAPLFFTVGILAKGSSLFQSRLKYAAAALVVGLGLYTFNGVLVATDSPYEFKNVLASIGTSLTGNRVAVAAGDRADAATSVVINVRPNGYSPNEITVPAGKKVTLKLASSGSLGCTSIFRIPKLNIESDVPQRGSTSVVATFPTPGRYAFTCGMGMFRGTVNAV